jgi:hypothetical protein
MTTEQVTLVAKYNDLGPVRFEEKIALNTGRPFEVAYIGRGRTLFAKRTSFSESWYLCNEFRGLEVSLEGLGAQG